MLRMREGGKREGRGRNLPEMYSRPLPSAPTRGGGKYGSGRHDYHLPPRHVGADPSYRSCPGAPLNATKRVRNTSVDSQLRSPPSAARDLDGDEYGQDPVRDT